MCKFSFSSLLIPSPFLQSPLSPFILLPHISFSPLPHPSSFFLHPSSFILRSSPLPYPKNRTNASHTSTSGLTSTPQIPHSQVRQNTPTSTDAKPSILALLFLFLSDLSHCFGQLFLSPLSATCPLKYT